MKRLLALIILAGLAFAAYHYWRTGTSPVNQAQLGSVTETMDAVGGKLRSTKLAGSVKAALELNRTLAPLPIDSSTEGDVVILRGEVPTEEARLLAEKVAGGVPDVRQVRNELRVNPAATGTVPGDERTVGENLDDRGLEGKVRVAFSLNRELKGTDISVSVYRKVVTLSGDVGSEAQRQAALLVARDTPGVASVSDQLRVGGGGAAAAPSAGPGGPAVLAPGATAQAVGQAFAASPSLAAYRLTAREEGGRVVLAGVVRTAAEKELAGSTAQGAARTITIDNQIEIRP